MRTVIGDFRGKDGFLSNFHRHPVVWNGVEAGSAEHHFNAAKTLDPTQRAEVYAQPTPSKAKAVGRRVSLRPGWDDLVRYDVMRSVVNAKFYDPMLTDKLLATGDALLIEGTSGWCDQTWGCCGCPRHRAWPGANHLGRTLMSIRSLLRGDPADRWPRVALTGHRPQSMAPGTRQWVRSTLADVAAKLRDQHGSTVAISGFGVGADIDWAIAAKAARLSLWAYIPFEAQPARWTPGDQATWAAVRANADREVVLGDGFDVRLLHARNDLMIRDADVVVAVHHPQKTTGGTAVTVRRAIAAGKPLIRINIESHTVTLVRDHITDRAQGTATV